MELFSFSKAGSRHRELGKPNEDYIACKEAENGLIVSVVCDGAGSMRSGGRAAEILAPKILDWMTVSFSTQYFSDGETVRRRLVQLIRSTLQEYAWETGEKLSELGCTVMVAAISPDGRCLCINLGDGILLRQKQSYPDHLADIISPPERGLSADSTFLTTSPNLFRHIRYYRWKDSSAEKIIMLTDGAANCILSAQDPIERTATALCSLDTQGLREYSCKSRPIDDYSIVLLSK